MQVVVQQKSAKYEYEQLQTISTSGCDEMWMFWSDVGILDLKHVSTELHNANIVVPVTDTEEHLALCSTSHCKMHTHPFQ